MASYTIRVQKTEKYSSSAHWFVLVLVKNLKCRPSQIGINETPKCCILRKDLARKTYKVQIIQELKPIDHQKSRTFVNFIRKQPVEEMYVYGHQDRGI